MPPTHTNPCLPDLLNPWGPKTWSAIKCVCMMYNNYIILLRGGPLAYLAGGPWQSVHLLYRQVLPKSHSLQRCEFIYMYDARGVVSLPPSPLFILGGVGVKHPLATHGTLTFLCCAVGVLLQHSGLCLPETWSCGTFRHILEPYQQWGTLYMHVRWSLTTPSHACQVIIAHTFTCMSGDHWPHLCQFLSDNIPYMYMYLYLVI